MATNTEKIKALQNTMTEVQGAQDSTHESLRIMKEHQEENSSAMEERFAALEASIRVLAEQMPIKGEDETNCQSQSSQGFKEDTCSLSEKIKIWQRTMVLNKVNSKGDFHFQLLKRLSASAREVSASTGDGNRDDHVSFRERCSKGGR